MPVAVNRIISALEKSDHHFRTLLLQLIMTALIGGLFYAVGTILVTDSIERTTRRLRGLAIRAGLRRDEPSAAEVTSVVLQDAQVAKGWWLVLWMFLPSTLVTIATSAVALLSTDVYAALVVFGTCGCFAVLTIVINVRVAHMSEDLQARYAGAHSTIGAVLRGRSAVVGSWLRDRLNSITDAEFRTVQVRSFRVSTLGLTIVPLTFLLQPVAVSLILTVRGDSMPAGTVVSTMLYAGMIASPASQLGSQLPRLAEASGALRRLKRLGRPETSQGATLGLSRSQEDTSLSSLPVHQPKSGTLFTMAGDLARSYPEVRVHNIDGIIVISGPSGCGKSRVLAQLSAALEDRGWGNQSTLVDQEVSTWGLPIHDYLSTSELGPRARRPRSLEAALEAVDLHEIARDSTLGTRTALELSVGERRRLAIARSLLRAAPISMFDEPLAGLDNERRHMVISRLWELSRESAVVVCGHDVGPWTDTRTIPKPYQQSNRESGPCAEH